MNKTRMIIIWRPKYFSLNTQTQLNSFYLGLLQPLFETTSRVSLKPSSYVLHPTIGNYKTGPMTVAYRYKHVLGLLAMLCVSPNRLFLKDVFGQSITSSISSTLSGCQNISITEDLKNHTAYGNLVDSVSSTWESFSNLNLNITANDTIDLSISLENQACDSTTLIATKSTLLSYSSVPSSTSPLSSTSVKTTTNILSGSLMQSFSTVMPSTKTMTASLSSTTVTAPQSSTTVTAPQSSTTVTAPQSSTTMTALQSSSSIQSSTNVMQSTTITDPQSSTTVTASQSSTTVTAPRSSTTVKLLAYSPLYKTHTFIIHKRCLLRRTFIFMDFIIFYNIYNI